MESADFEAALAALSEGYSEGIYEGVGLRGSDDGGRYSLFERELARRGIISFNLYRLRSHNASLKPCEMSANKGTELVFEVAIERVKRNSEPERMLRTFMIPGYSRPRRKLKRAEENRRFG